MIVESDLVLKDKDNWNFKSVPREGDDKLPLK